jgi:hypothetical protein
VDTLSSGYVYKSRVHFNLGDMVMVDHNTKTCFIFFVRLTNLKNHPVKVSLLTKVMNHLKIREKNYTLQLVFVTDTAVHRQSGSMLKTTAKLTLEEWRAAEMEKKIKTKSQKIMLSELVKSVIVRTPMSHPRN